MNCDGKYNLYKYKLSDFIKLSIVSKISVLDDYYNEFIELEGVDAKQELTYHKYIVLNSAFAKYEKMRTKKNYKMGPKDNKNVDDWKQKYDPKIIKTLDFRPVKLDENKSTLKQPMQLKQLQLKEIQNHYGLNYQKKILAH